MCRTAARTQTNGLLLGAALAIAVAVVFWPLRRGGFFLDDFVRLYDLANYGLVKLLLSPHGGHLLLTSNGVYALFRSLFGLEPAAWFTAVLALHILNTLLLYSLLRRFACRRLVAVTLAALWGLCPVHVWVLAWMAVFGHTLLATILLLLLRDLAGAAARGEQIRTRRAWLWCLLGLLGATSFANGLGVAMALPVACAALLYERPGSRLAWKTASSLVLVVPALYVVQHALYAYLFDVPPFMTFVGALHVEPHRIPGQVVQMGWLALDMLAYGFDVLLLGSQWSGLRLDPRPWRSLPPLLQNAWLGVPAAALVLLATWALWHAPRRRRAQVLGLGVLAVAANATLAVGGVLVSRLDALAKLGWSWNDIVTNQAMQPRYQYVPSLLLAASLGLAAESAATRGNAARRSIEIILLATLAWLALRAPTDRALIALQVSRMSLYKNALREVDREVQRWPPRSTVYLVNGPFGRTFLNLHSPVFPGKAALSVIAHPDGIVGGRTVRFVERDPDLLAILQGQVGTPISRLVISPDAVPGGGPPPAP